MHQLVPLVKLASCLLKNNDVFHPLTSNAMKVLFYARVLRDAYPLTSEYKGLLYKNLTKQTVTFVNLKPQQQEKISIKGGKHTSGCSGRGHPPLVVAGTVDTTH